MRFVICQWSSVIGLLSLVFCHWSVGQMTKDKGQRTTQVTVFDVDGGTASGELVSLTDERLAVRRPDNRSWATSDLLKAELTGRRLAPDDSTAANGMRLGGAVVLLANGDRLVATPALTDDDGNLAVTWSEHPSWPPVRVPLETIRGIMLDVSAVESVRHKTFQLLLDATRTNDVVFLKNGDRLAGELLGLDGSSLRLQTTVGKTEIERSGVRAVGFNSELISFPKAEGKRMLFTLDDGSRVTGHNVRLTSEGVIEIEALFGRPLSVPLSAVVTIRFLGGRAEYLSDLEPAEYRFTPYLAARWPLKNDSNVIGGPLRLQGREFPKGLGMHSQSAVTYKLDGKYQRFQAVIGIDDAAERQGSVVFAVEVDGKRVFESGVLTGSDPPQAIAPIPLRGADRLTLIVEFGPFGDVRDYADFCDPVLIR